MRKLRKPPEEASLDLVPVMNLVTILIPFLLMSAQFVTLAVIDSTLPAIVDNTEVVEQPEDEEEKLGLSILLTTDGFTLTGKGIENVLPKEDDDDQGPKVPCLEPGCPNPDSYDYDELRARLVKLKDNWPDEDSAILVPESTIPYEVVVLTMDAAREDPDDVVDETTQKKRELYPYVVIAAGVN